MTTIQNIRKMHSTFMLKATSGMSEFEAYTDRKGIYRWVSNQRVVPDDVLAFNNVDFVIRAKCEIIRKLEDKKFMREYRRSMNHVPSAKEKSEMRAAFGPDVKEVVNVITGRRTKL